MTKISVAERMAVIETQISNINNKLDDHICEQRKQFDIIAETQAAQYKNLEDSISKLSTKFAGKWTEKVALATITALIVFILNLLFKFI